MSEGYIGEIRIFPYGFAPENWLECNGQTRPVQQYQALYAVIGNTYGGNGTTDFALPNLQGSVPVGTGQGPGLSACPLGSKRGTVGETLGAPQMPAHSHTITVKAGKSDASKEGNAVFLSDPAKAAWNVPATRPSSTADYAPVTGFSATASEDAYLAPATLAAAGGDPKGAALVHENQQPFLALRFCICCNGIFPARA